MFANTHLMNIGGAKVLTYRPTRLLDEEEVESGAPQQDSDGRAHAGKITPGFLTNSLKNNNYVCIVLSIYLFS